MLRRALILSSLAFSSGCASSTVYQSAAKSIFPPVGIDYLSSDFYQVEYSRTNTDGTSETSMRRDGEAYRELLVDVESCVHELDEQLERIRVLFRGPTTSQATVRLMACLRRHGWNIDTRRVIVVT